jgi:hypothetical protein
MQKPKVRTEFASGLGSLIASFDHIGVQRMVCTACGAEADASCNCGKPYVPAKERAAKAVAENPQKSDRAIAAEIGVSHPTVAKARKESTGNDLPVGEPRIGLDGKARKQTGQAARQDAGNKAGGFSALD